LEIEQAQSKAIIMASTEFLLRNATFRFSPKMDPVGKFMGLNINASWMEKSIFEGCLVKNPALPALWPILTPRLLYNLQLEAEEKGLPSCTNNQLHPAQQGPHRRTATHKPQINLKTAKLPKI